MDLSRITLPDYMHDCLAPVPQGGAKTVVQSTLRSSLWIKLKPDSVFDHLFAQQPSMNCLLSSLLSPQGRFFNKSHTPESLSQAPPLLQLQTWDSCALRGESYERRDHKENLVNMEMWEQIEVSCYTVKSFMSVKSHSSIFNAAKCSLIFGL